MANIGPSTRWGRRLITSDGTTIAQAVGALDSRRDAADLIAWTRANAADCSSRTTYRSDILDPDGNAVVTSVQFADRPEDVEQSLEWIRTMRQLALS